MIRKISQTIQRIWTRYIKIILVYSLIILSFIPFLYNNFYVMYFVNSTDHYKWLRKNRGFNKYLGVTSSIAMRQTWTMFSPSWKKIYKINFWGVRGPGDYELLNIPNLSKEHRESRPLVNALFFDFKVARYLASYYHDHGNHRGHFRKQFINYYCQNSEELLGWTPEEVTVVVRETAIPKPENRGDWHPLTTTYERVQFTDTYPCKEI